MVLNRQKKIHFRKTQSICQHGFTLVEILVATVIFATVVTSLGSLFSYTLRLNRKTDALRQATQGMKNFVEFLVKEIRNGEIEYGLVGGAVARGFDFTPSSICGPGNTVSNYYQAKENRISIINTDGEYECFYLANSSNNYVGAGVFTGSTVVMLKQNDISQAITPPNFKVESLMFAIRPVCDPYNGLCPKWSGVGTEYPNLQPMVHMTFKFVANLPTGENVPIYYQTTVSTNKYDYPNN